jgi:phage replication-related protein YjqB (UPF0714/DUF867 family)
MPDTYRNFAELANSERPGNYRVRFRRARSEFAIVAPHGGGIEMGTSEIADAIAGGQFAFYAFEGLKLRGNQLLHITSVRFDEPECVRVLGDSVTVVTLHGAEDDEEIVYMGGLDTVLGGRIGMALIDKGFEVGEHPKLLGRERRNVCNRGKSGKGVQLELSTAVRETLFASLTTRGRKAPTGRFDDFVTAVSTCLDSRQVRSPQ